MFSCNFLLIAIKSFLVLVFQGTFKIILQNEISCLNMLFIEKSLIHDPIFSH